MLQPLGDRLLIKVLSATAETKSGLIIPDAAKEKSQEGEVLSIGSDVTHINPGNKVLFGKYSGAEIKIDGQDLLIMHQDDIFGVIHE